MTDPVSVIGPASPAAQQAGILIADRILASAQAKGLLPITTKISVLCVHSVKLMHGQFSCGSEFAILDTPLGFLLKVETDNDDPALGNPPVWH